MTWGMSEVIIINSSSNGSNQGTNRTVFQGPISGGGGTTAVIMG